MKAECPRCHNKIVTLRRAETVHVVIKILKLEGGLYDYKFKQKPNDIHDLDPMNIFCCTSCEASWNSFEDLLDEIIQNQNGDDNV